MALRTLITATALLVAGCFVDNKPVGATANNTGSDTTGSASATTTTGATSLPTGSSDADSTATGSLTSTTGSTTTTTGDPATTTPVTTDPATTDPPVQCKSLGVLGWSLNDPACRACVTAECCEPFDSCASMAPCAEAWDCIAGEPCPGKWPQCPGAVESAVPLVSISNCLMGPCFQVCNLPCLPQIAACDAEPQCGAYENCIAACNNQCMNDNKCLALCSSDCGDGFPNGLDPALAKDKCQNPTCG